MSNTTKNDGALSAQHGFLCIFLLVLGTLGLNEAIRFVCAASPSFATLAREHNPLINGCIFLIQNAIWLIIAFLFTRGHFALTVGLSRPATLVGWLVALAGVILGNIAILGSKWGWIAQDRLSSGFYQAGAASAWFFAIYATLVAPFAEEVIMRGLLYPAFRANFGIAVSIALVLGVHAYFHFGLISHAPLVWPILILLNITLCLLREKTPSLWNCVLCHSAYNATQSMHWLICATGMLVILPFCILGTRRKITADWGCHGYPIRQ